MGQNPYKRAISSTKNPNVSEPKTKPTKKSESPIRYIYIVKHDGSMHGEDFPDISGMFLDLEDANNCMKRLVEQEYHHSDELCEITTLDEGGGIVANKGR